MVLALEHGKPVLVEKAFTGTEGYIRIDNINCPETIEVWRNYELVERIDKPISIMKQMDSLRKEWGVRYPFDDIS